MTHRNAPVSARPVPHWDFLDPRTPDLPGSQRESSSNTNSYSRVATGQGKAARSVQQMAVAHALTGAPAIGASGASPSTRGDEIRFEGESHMISSECQGCLECCLPCMRPKRLSPLHQAVILVRNAYHGRPPALPTPWSMAARRVYHSRGYRLFSAMMALLLCGLGFAEPTRTGDTPPSMLVPVTEIICLCFFAADCGLQYVYLGRDILVSKRWTVVKAFLVPLSILSMAAVYATDEWSWAFLRLVRPVFLLERFRNVRRIAASIISATPKILSVAAMLGMSNVLFGVLGFVLFAGIGDDGNCVAFKGGPPPATPCSVFLPASAGGCRDFFATLLESMTQLFILTTTANFPDVMLPAYKCNRWSALFFVAYILLSTLFLLNLVLAATYTEFKALTERKVLARYSNIFDGVDLAFVRLVAISERSASQAPFPHDVSPPAATGLPVTPQSTSVRPTSPNLGAVVASPSGVSLLGDPVSSSSCLGPPLATAADTPLQQSSPSVRASAHAMRLAPYKPRPREYRGIGRDLWTQFFQALHPGTPTEACHRMFDSVDGDGRGLVYQIEFRRMILFFGRLKVKHPSRGGSVAARMRRRLGQASHSVRSLASSVTRSGKQLPKGAVESPLAERAVVKMPTAAAASARPSGRAWTTMAPGAAAAGAGGGTGLRPAAPAAHSLPPSATPQAAAAAAAATVGAGAGSGEASAAPPAAGPASGAGGERRPRPSAQLWGIGNGLRASVVGLVAYALASDEDGEGLGAGMGHEEEEDGDEAHDEDDDDEDGDDERDGAGEEVAGAESDGKEALPAGAGPMAGSTAAVDGAESVEDWGAASARQASRHGSAVGRWHSGRLAEERPVVAEHNCCGSAGWCESDPVNRDPAPSGRAKPGGGGGGEGAWACTGGSKACRRWRRRARPVLRKRAVTWGFDLAVMVNAVAVLYELTMTASSASGAQQLSSSQAAVDVVQYLTLGIFLLEVAVKVWAFGLCRYARSNFNKLDIIIAVAAIAGTVLELSLDRARLEAQWSSAITFVRTLRILRPLRAIAGFGTTVKAFLDILPVLGQYLTVLVAVFYAFGIVGVGAFAGVLQPSNARVAASSYGVAGFYAYNFDDLGSAMTSLFYLMVVNNWPIIMEGCVAATNSSWTRAYFVAFYFITVVLVLSVLVAFIIESFGLQKARIDQSEEVKQRRRRQANLLAGEPDADEGALYHGEGDQEPAGTGDGVRFRVAAAGVGGGVARKVKRTSVGEASRWRQRLLEANTNTFGDAPASAGEWRREQEQEQDTWDAILGFQFTSSSSLSRAAQQRLDKLPKPKGAQLAEAVERLMDHGGGWRAVPAGSEWRLMLGRAGHRLDDFRVKTVQSPFDIYDSLYRDGIQRKFPKTFSAARRKPLR